MNGLVYEEVGGKTQVWQFLKLKELKGELDWKSEWGGPMLVYAFILVFITSMASVSFSAKNNIMLQELLAPKNTRLLEVEINLFLKKCMFLYCQKCQQNSKETWGNTFQKEGGKLHCIE